MENRTDDSLMKGRSAGACVATGYRLYSASFRRIFRYTWLPALVYALANGLLGAYAVTEYPRLLIALNQASINFAAVQQEFLFSVIVLGLGAIVAVAASTVLTGYGFALLRMHQTTGQMAIPLRWLSVDKRTLWLTVKATLFTLASGLVAVGLLTLLSTLGDHLPHIASMAMMGVAYVAVLCLSLPLCYVFTKYVLSDDTSFIATLKASYGTGFRHLGFLMLVLLVAAMVYSAVALFTTVPALILSLANMQAQTGLLIGDPLGMPSYIVPLTMVVFVAAGFIQAYLVLSVLFPLYYTYGSIETTEAEKKSALEKL